MRLWYRWRHRLQFNEVQEHEVGRPDLAGLEANQVALTDVSDYGLRLIEKVMGFAEGRIIRPREIPVDPSVAGGKGDFCAMLSVD